MSQKIMLSLSILSVLLCGATLAAEPELPPAADKAFTCRITDFGAVGNGETLCTAAIQKAIDKTSESGGGTVYCPAGIYRSGTVILKSRVTLHLDAGCTIIGSADLDHYPEKIPAIRSLTDFYTRRSVIYAEDQENIAIEGDGTIDGNGENFPHAAPHSFIRPYLVRIINCKDVRVEGVEFRDPAMWTHHYMACENVQVTGVRIRGFANGNNDGIDIDGCRNVTISDSTFCTSDDGITMKSTTERPTEGVTITNCVVATRSSAIKMGTESTGGFRDITISNCTVKLVPSDRPRIFHGRNGLVGIELIIVDGGIMERVNVSDVNIEGYTVPMSLRLGARGRGLIQPHLVPENERPERRPLGIVRDVSFSNIIATGGGRNCGIMLLGHPGHNLENISLSNILVRNAGGGGAELADRVIPERAYNYPQAVWWGYMSAYGLYARHVRGLSVSNLRLQTAQPDARHALVLDDVQNTDLNGISCMPAVGTNALFKLAQTSDVMIRGCRPKSAEGAFLKIDGENCFDIALTGNDFTHVKQIMELAGQAPADAVRQIGNFEPAYAGAALVSHPVSQFVEAGSMVEFTVRAQNATAYEWYKQTSDKDKLVASHKISAEKDTLRLTDIRADDEGVYYCVVKNKEGDDTSATAELRLKKLIGHWKFDGNVNDSSGFSHHGKIHGGAEFVKTGAGKALSLDGNDGYVEIPPEALVPVGDEISILLWQYGANSQPRRDFIFTAKRKNNELGFECHLPYNDGKVYWYTGDNSDRLSKAAKPAEYKGKWHHWCFVKKGTTGKMAIYLDGELWASRTDAFSGGFTSDLTQFAVGTRLNPNGQPDGPYAGKIRDFRVYNYALSPDDISNIYSETK